MMNAALAVMMMSNEPTKEFTDGVQYALDYLAEIFDGITETDLWHDFMADDGDDEN